MVFLELFRPAPHKIEKSKFFTFFLDFVDFRRRKIKYTQRRYWRKLCNSTSKQLSIHHTSHSCVYEILYAEHFCIEKKKIFHFLDFHRIFHENFIAHMLGKYWCITCTLYLIEYNWLNSIISTEKNARRNFF